MKYSSSNYVPLLKAFADETRLKIIDMLSSGEMCACHLLEQLNITQPTLSYHMRILTQCELISGRKEGIWMKYRLNTEKVDEYRQFLDELLAPQQQCICNTSEEGCNGY